VWSAQSLSCQRISDTEWRCSGSKRNSILYTKSSYVNKDQGYTIYFRLRNNAHYDEGYGLNDYIGVGALKGSILTILAKAKFYDNNFLLFNVNVDENSKILVYDKDYRFLDNYLNFTIDYVIVKKQADLEPVVTIVQDGEECKRNYEVVVGRHIKWVHLGSFLVYDEDNLLLKYKGFSNRFLRFYLYHCTWWGCNYNILKDSLRNFDYFSSLFFIDTKNSPSSYDGTIKRNNVSIYYEDRDSYTERYMLFANSRWFIVNVNKLFPSSTEETLKIINYGDGSLIPETHQKCNVTYISEIVDFNYEKIKNKLYFPGGAHTLVFFENKNVNPPRYLLVSYSPTLSTYSYLTSDMDKFFSEYAKPFDKNEFASFLIYFYAYNRSISDVRNFAMHFALPKVVIKGVNKIYAIPINEISSSDVPNNVYITFDGFSKTLGDPSVLNSYSFRMEKLVYVFDSSRDALVKTIATIYVR